MGSGASVTTRRAKNAKPPKGLDETFKFHIEHAIELSEEAVRRSPEDPDAHYELGASIALAASYKASIEGDPLRASETQSEPTGLTRKYWNSTHAERMQI